MPTLGKTGLVVSDLGFGGLFASSLGPGFEESKRAVFRAVDRGINLFDTAPGYADSEEILGKILREVKGRESAPLILSTKLGGRPRPFDPRDAAALVRSAETSLANLGREVIDILIVHEPDRPLQYNWWTDPEAVAGPVLDALETLKRRGLIRFTGLGGTTCAEMAHCIRSDRFDVVLTAFNYSALFREAAHEVLPEAAARNMGVLLGSCLQQGALGRRYELRTKPAWMAKGRHEQFLAFYKLLDDSGLSIVEMCLRFAVGGPGVVLIGPKTAAHVDESVAVAAKGPLPADVRARLDQIAAMMPYRPFEEPMILPLSNPRAYYGPGLANLGIGVPVGKDV